MKSDAVVARADVGDPALDGLLTAAIAELVVRYGGAAHEGPLTPAATYLVATVDGYPAGCIARVPVADGLVEMKRVFVDDGFRGRGIASLLVRTFEDEARADGVARIRLETGTKQPEAIALYEKLGYVRIENFGVYADSPLSRSYAKDL
ncbi:GNAT family N-acetyltransferase [Kineococcus rubinsiae]|uniref:GNAT family N-acetyltransferase n=1 Tax=Kineococcus rubinsiae TaxID=2609562 RepID=UPI00142FB186|nr:GNAT family N-acetyltransferase [Kineococcus rubinsiae]NIZ93214.1 GNAT family N-acetyltransferase [Kineococcus rubinsiae]